MYIHSILSFLGAWKEFEDTCPEVIEDIERAIASVTDLTHYRRSGWQRGSHREAFVSVERRETRSRESTPSFDARAMNRDISEQLEEFGWERHIRLMASRPNFRHVGVMAAKNGVGIELILGQRSFLESMLFVRLPMLIKARRLHGGILLVPMYQLARDMSPGIGSHFQGIQEILGSGPVPLRYPFAIVGLAMEPPAERQMTSLTSKLDEFLMKQPGGYSLDEMLVFHEMPHYDFKVTMPAVGNVRNTICAFANLPHGGMLILGVADDGTVPGVAKGPGIDKMEQALTSAVRDSKFDPMPQLAFHVFDAPEATDRCILVVRVLPSELKPCMLDGRIHVRSGPTTRVATPDDIRRMVLGGTPPSGGDVVG